MPRRGPKGFNRHHVMHTRETWMSDWQGSRIRTLGGVILSMPIEDHQELHTQVEPLEVPSRVLGRIILNHMEPLENLRIPRIERFDSLKELLHDVAETAGRRLGNEAFQMVDNLEQQSQFFNHVRGNV